MRYNSVQIHQVFICTVIHHPCFEISYVVFLNFYVFCPGQSLCFIVVVHLPGFIHRAWNEFSLTSEPWCRDKVKKLYFSTIISSNIRQDQEVMLCPVRLIICIWDVVFWWSSGDPGHQHQAPGRDHAISDGCETLMTQLPGQYCTDGPLHPTLGGEIDCFGSRGPGPGEPSGQRLHHRHSILLQFLLKSKMDYFHNDPTSSIV